MDGPAFAVYVEKVLIPELDPGTVVILDHVARTKPRSRPRRCELCLNLGDAASQAARFSVSWFTSTPSLNLVPSMTFGHCFLPLRRSHFFDAA